MHDVMLKNKWIMCCFATLQICILGMSDLFAMEIELMTNVCMVLSNNLVLGPKNFQTRKNSAWIYCGINEWQKKAQRDRITFFSCDTLALRWIHFFLLQGLC